MRNIAPFCLLLTFSLFSCTPKVTEVITEETVTTPIKTIVDTPEKFPDAWLGNWKGTLHIYNEKGKAQELPMELELAEIEGAENYVWAIIYGEDKEKGRRPYELRVVDAEKGVYVIDEKNTIELESYLLGNKLYNRFLVAESLLLCTYEKKGDTMIFEVISGKNEAISTTGGKVVDGEEIPVVKTYPIIVSQRAELKRY